MDYGGTIIIPQSPRGGLNLLLVENSFLINFHITYRSPVYGQQFQL